MLTRQLKYQLFSSAVLMCSTVIDSDYQPIILLLSYFNRSVSCLYYLHAVIIHHFLFQITTESVEMCQLSSFHQPQQPIGLSDNHHQCLPSVRGFILLPLGADAPQSQHQRLSDFIITSNLLQWTITLLLRSLLIEIQFTFIYNELYLFSLIKINRLGRYEEQIPLLYIFGYFIIYQRMTPECTMFCSNYFPHKHIIWLNFHNVGHFDRDAFLACSFMIKCVCKWYLG